MNVLYILGNGFDLAQGMKTSYPDFYQYLTWWNFLRYPKLRKMKRAINKDKALWSDMEEALGQYTEQFSDVERFRDMYFELSDFLQDYLRAEENKFLYIGLGAKHSHHQKIMLDLINPFQYMLELDRNRFESLYQNTSYYNPEIINISVMTLNYTNTLETLLDFNDVPKKITGLNGNHGMLNDIIHVHGEVGDTIIIGVDNKEQISNKTFRNDSNATDLLIKKESISLVRTLVQDKCKALISEANIIILFGVSLGKTDNHWWRLIGDEIIKRDVFILQFLYSTLIKGNLARRKNLINTILRDHRKDFMNKLGLVGKVDDERFSDLVFFIVNSRMFAPI